MSRPLWSIVALWLDSSLLASLECQKSSDGTVFEATACVRE